MFRMFFITRIVSFLALIFGNVAFAQVDLVPLGTFSTGVFDGGAAEIPAYDPKTNRVFVVNAADSTIDVLDISNPSSPTRLFQIDVTPFGDQANSVAVSKKGVVAAAIQANVKTDPGVVAFFNTDGDFISSVQVGALPDMLTFTKNGKKVLVANEGEPSDDYITDPEGSVSIINLKRGPERVTQVDVITAGFTAFNGAVLDPSIRVYGPNATATQDMEPEYIAVSENGATAWVTLQENNAIGILDVNAGQFTQLVGLGFKDHNSAGNELDAGDDDGALNIANWPVLGMYLPDAIAAYDFDGETFLFTANEGDARDYEAFSEESRIEDLTLDPTAFPNAAALQTDAQIGRLNVTTTKGDTDTDLDYDQLFSLGGRSFSIWNASGEQVFDSGDDLEQITSAALPTDFNADNAENDTFDNRSDNKGPEPEGIVLGKAYGRVLAFICLERIGGVAIYDVTDPLAPVFLSYSNNRDFAGDAEAGTAKDLGPEGMVFVKKGQSPTKKPLLIVSNEISGSTTIFEIVKTP